MEEIRRAIDKIRKRMTYFSVGTPGNMDLTGALHMWTLFGGKYGILTIALVKAKNNTVVCQLLYMTSVLSHYILLSPFPKYSHTSISMCILYNTLNMIPYCTCNVPNQKSAHSSYIL